MKPISLTLLAATLAVLSLAGCSDNREVAESVPAPVHFSSGDECHVCGMVITRFPGPKGEAITGKEQQVLRFCSTRDMFAWALQPENAGRNHTLYVHDMAQTEWEHPDDTALVDARKAFYVVGSERLGAMGPTLASFASREAAHAFMQKYGGQVLTFGEITLAHLVTDHGGDDAAAMPVSPSQHEQIPSMHEHQH